MRFLYLLEKLRMPVLNELMLAVTTLGEETAFLVIALIVFWCVDKKKGYYVMAVGFMGTMINQMLKLACRVPRPWVLDPNFTVLEGAKDAATGYSFPSGHSQNAVGTFGAIASTTKTRWLKGICIAVAVLVPLSRMYIGVHTPQDVLVGSAMALVLVFGLRPVILGKDGKNMPWLIGAMVAMAVGYLLYVSFYPFPVDMDAHNLQSGVKNAYTMLGSLTAVAVVYPLERKFVNFSTRAVWWVQLLKVGLGLSFVLLIKEGLRSPLDAVFAGHMVARAVWYFLTVTAAGLLWPMTFRWFSKLGEDV